MCRLYGQCGIYFVSLVTAPSAAGLRRRVFAIAEQLDQMMSSDGSVEGLQWCLDNWDAVAVSGAAAQNVPLGVTSQS